MIYHESLAQYARILRARPTIVKLHGDAKIQPLSSLEDTKELHERFKRKVKALLSEAGIIFLGYGGNDKSITKILNELPEDSLPEGIFWVNDHIPDTDFGKWLKQRNTTCVNHLDFDKFMAEMFVAFNLKHLDEEIRVRSEKICSDYRKSVEEFVEKTGAKPDDQELSDAISKAVQSADNWWGVELEARRYKKSDPNKANEIYLRGLERFRNSYQLATNYALFLKNILKDYDEAEKMLKKALELEPNIAITTDNYAFFLTDIRKDHDKAEKLYKKALELDPNDATTIGHYALFLTKIRREYDEAEKLFKKVLELDPDSAYGTGNYATFLFLIRKDYDRAQRLFEKSLTLDANIAYSNSNYGGLLLSRGQVIGFGFVDRACELAIDTEERRVLLKCHFYRYAHSDKNQIRRQDIEDVRKMLLDGVRSPNFDLSQNVERAIADGHPEPEFLKALAKVISDEAGISELDKFKVWKETDEKDK